MSFLFSLSLSLYVVLLHCIGILIADLPGTEQQMRLQNLTNTNALILFWSRWLDRRGWFKVELEGAYLAVFTGAPKPCKWRLLLKTAPIPVLPWSIFISLLLQRKPYDSLCSIFLGLCKRVFLFLAAEALLYLGKRAKTFAIKGGGGGGLHIESSVIYGSWLQVFAAIISQDCCYSSMKCNGFVFIAICFCFCLCWCCYQ